MQEKHLTDELSRIIRKRMTLSVGRQLRPTDRLVEDLGLDSIDLLELVVDIERRWDMEFNDDELLVEVIGTVGRLTQTLHDHLSTNADCPFSDNRNEVISDA